MGFNETIGKLKKIKKSEELESIKIITKCDKEADKDKGNSSAYDI